MAVTELDATVWWYYGKCLSTLIIVYSRIRGASSSGPDLIAKLKKRNFLIISIILVWWSVSDFLQILNKINDMFVVFMKTNDHTKFMNSSIYTFLIIEINLLEINYDILL